VDRVGAAVCDRRASFCQTGSCGADRAPLQITSIHEDGLQSYL